MPWPDRRARQGWRSKAQMAWGHGTDQWFADVYDKFTPNPDMLPDRVTEDENEGILSWLEENYGVIDEGIWDKIKNSFKKNKNGPDNKKYIGDSFNENFREITQEFYDSKNIDSLENNADKIFELDKFFRTNFPNEKLSKTFRSNIVAIEKKVNQWRQKGMSPDYEEKWEEFFNYHGSVLKGEETIDSLELEKEKESKNLNFDLGMFIGLLIQNNKNIPDEIYDAIDNATSSSRSVVASERSLKGKDFTDIDNKDLLLAGIKDAFSSSGDDEDIKSTMYQISQRLQKMKKITKSIEQEFLSEGACFKKISKKYNIDEELVEKMWDDSISECEKTIKESKSSKLFWKKVVETFKKKINKLDILEAKRIMDSKRALRANVENFLNNLASGDYDAAQRDFPKVVREKLNTMINSKKETYMKDIGAAIKEKSKGA